MGGVWTGAGVLRTDGGNCQRPKLEGLNSPAGSKTGGEILPKSRQSMNLEASGLDRLPPRFVNLTVNWVRSL